MNPTLRAGTRPIARAGTFVSGWRSARLGIACAALALVACAAPRRPALHRVVIQRFLYAPATLEVAAGDTVEWSNQDIVPHTATAKSGAWDSQAISTGATWRTVLVKPGTERYGCRFHPNMGASLVVR